MIYLNNAATSFPKLPQVKEAVLDYMDALPQSQYRSSGNDRAALPVLCKRKLGELLHIRDYERIAFTSGATEAANLIINGLPLKGKHVLVTANEHNCVLRALYNYRDNIKISVIPCNLEGGLDYRKFEDLLEQAHYAVFVNHCSNVTGRIMDIEKIYHLVKSHNSRMVLDISQSAGAVPVNMEKVPADAVFFTCHKSLMGIVGLGGFYTKEPDLIKATKFGGTGKDSWVVKYSFPADFEVGTQNDAAMAALCPALDYILEQTPEEIHKKEQALIRYVKEELGKLPDVAVYGGGDIQGPVLSFNIKGFQPSDIGYILTNVYDIIVRTGFHCAPFIHQYIGTGEQGTVRVSISPISEKEELEVLIQAVKEICSR